MSVAEGVSAADGNVRAPAAVCADRFAGSVAGGAAGGEAATGCVAAPEPFACCALPAAPNCTQAGTSTASKRATPQARVRRTDVWVVSPISRRMRSRNCVGPSTAPSAAAPAIRCSPRRCWQSSAIRTRESAYTSGSHPARTTRSSQHSSRSTPHTLRHKPHSRMEEQEGLDQPLQQVGQMVVPPNVGQFMRQQHLDLPRRETAGDRHRQQDHRPDNPHHRRNHDLPAEPDRGG